MGCDWSWLSAKSVEPRRHAKLSWRRWLSTPPTPPPPPPQTSERTWWLLPGQIAWCWWLTTSNWQHPQPAIPSSSTASFSVRPSVACVKRFNFSCIFFVHIFRCFFLLWSLPFERPLPHVITLRAALFGLQLEPLTRPTGLLTDLKTRPRSRASMSAQCFDFVSVSVDPP